MDAVEQRGIQSKCTHMIIRRGEAIVPNWNVGDCLVYRGPRDGYSGSMLPGDISENNPVVTNVKRGVICIVLATASNTDFCTLEVCLLTDEAVAWFPYIEFQYAWEKNDHEPK